MAEEKLKKRGVSVRIMNRVMLVAAFAVSAAMIVAMSMTSSLYSKTNDITSKLVSWRNNSYDLQLASDYLTEQMRSFAVSGDRQYLDNYFEEANVTKRREKALEKMKEQNVDQDALDELQNALDESMQLMNTEYYAAKLTIEGYGYDLSDYPEIIQVITITPADEELSADDKKLAAIGYLFGNSYVHSKERISSDMNDCLTKLEEDIYYEQVVLAAQLERQVMIEHILTYALLAIMLGGVLLISFLVFRPIDSCVDHMRKDEEIPLEGTYEVQFLAKNYNLMYYANQEHKEKLSHDASRDKLTKLYDKDGYEFLLNNVDMETSTLLILDLDDFEEINDTYGYDTGDKVLVRASQAIVHSFRGQDYVCRIGGDKFAVIMVRTDKRMRDMVVRKVEMINKKLEGFDDEMTPGVSCSVGVSFGKLGQSVGDMFKKATDALDTAKNNGKNGVAFYEGKKDSDKKESDKKELDKKDSSKKESDKKELDKKDSSKKESD